jgi:hypothetical protein
MSQRVKQFVDERVAEITKRVDEGKTPTKNRSLIALSEPNTVLLHRLSKKMEMRPQLVAQRLLGAAILDALEAIGECTTIDGQDWVEREPRYGETPTKA